MLVTGTRLCPCTTRIPRNTAGPSFDLEFRAHAPGIPHRGRTSCTSITHIRPHSHAHHPRTTRTDDERTRRLICIAPCLAPDAVGRESPKAADIRRRPSRRPVRAHPGLHHAAVSWVYRGYAPVQKHGTNLRRLDGCRGIVTLPRAHQTSILPARLFVQSDTGALPLAPLLRPASTVLSHRAPPTRDSPVFFPGMMPTRVSAASPLPGALRGVPPLAGGCFVFPAKMPGAGPRYHHSMAGSL